MPNLSGLSLRDLAYAMAVGELGHFGRAAERCGVSQPGLSEQIRKLETLLGCRLFERGRGGATPTASGQVLLRQIAVVVREARGLLEMADCQSGALNGRLSLGVIPTLGPYYIPQVLRELRAHFPSLVLRLQENQTGALLEAIGRFALDAALVALPVDQDGIVAAPLFFEPFRALMPTGHPLAEDALVDLDALGANGLLLLEDGHCLRDQTVSLCKAPAAATGEHRFASSLEMLRHMVAAGEGVSLMPVLATRDAGALGSLLAVRALADPHAGRTIGLIWRASDPRGDDFRQLGDVLRDAPATGTSPVAPATR